MIEKKYEDLSPDHELMTKTQYWGIDGQEVLNQDIDECIEYILDENFEEEGELEIFGFRKKRIKLDPLNDVIVLTCRVVVDIRDWIVEHNPHWLESNKVVDKTKQH